MKKQNWSARLAPYKTADNLRAIIEFFLTALPLAGLWVGIAWLFNSGSIPGVIAGIALLLPAAGFLVRLFILQHDCGHGSLFSSRAANDWFGRLLGVFTYTPYDYWRKQHAAHHATSGNLEGRGMGDIDTLTVSEYLQRDHWGKLKYRLYRHPLVMFGLGPAYVFLLEHRLPLATKRLDRSQWIGILATNAGIVLIALLLIQTFGLVTFLLVQLPLVVLGASIGVWLFYVQHQFDETYWDVKPNWTHEHAALHGSSYYDLPRPLMWLTGNIGIHHVHHLSSKIPFHKLPTVISAHPELKSIGRLTAWDSLKCVRLTLWDEHAKRLISFKEARHLVPA